MPWCPVCHAEYRAGVKVCRQCQAELVRTPPRPGERYTPPAENLLDTAAEALARSVRLPAWGRQIGQGLRLFGESFRLTLRMRNVWLVLTILTATSTIATLRPLQPIDAASLAMLRRTGGSFPAEMGRRALAPWSGLLPAIGHVSYDLRVGLSTPLGYASRLYRQLYVRKWSPGAPPPHWYQPPLLAAWVGMTLAQTFFLAGMLWWVLAAIRGAQQTAGRFWEGVRGSFWPLLAWLLAYGAAYQQLLALAFGRSTSTMLREAFVAVIAVAVLPFLFTSQVIVVQRPPVYEAPAISMQIFMTRLLVILGFAIPFIVLHDLVWGIDSGLRFHYYSTWDPEYAYRYVMPALAFVMQAAKVVLELLITTAFVILVARWKESGRAEPRAPEAASA